MLSFLDHRGTFQCWEPLRAWGATPQDQKHRLVLSLQTRFHRLLKDFSRPWTWKGPLSLGAYRAIPAGVPQLCFSPHPSFFILLLFCLYVQVWSLDFFYLSDNLTSCFEKNAEKSKQIEKFLCPNILDEPLLIFIIHLSRTFLNKQKHIYTNEGFAKLLI